MSLKLTVVSPEHKILENIPVSEVTLTGTEGTIQILPGHAPMIGILETGLFAYRDEGSQDHIGAISTGFFEVAGDQLTVMAETFEMKGEIDLDRAKRAQSKSEEMLKEANLDEHAFRKYQLKLQRSLIRQKAKE